MIIGLCNPLLDISASADLSFLEKYDLQPNNAILAEDKHKPMYQEIVEKYKVDYIAGGSGQNALRVSFHCNLSFLTFTILTLITISQIAQRLLKKPNVSIFMGCVGKDNFSEILAEKAKSDGVDVRYQVTDKESTGSSYQLLI